MQISLDTSKWWQRIWAALIFFTRLPFWRIYQPPQQCYSTVVEHWPLTGWLTGGVMALIIWFGSSILPHSLVILCAILSRVLITGALHEDGLADFFDGFGGGGNNKQRILDIMKDSRIGTYGVIALIFYFALLYATLFTLSSPGLAAIIVLGGDAYSKMVAGQIISFLPYARTEETSKAHTIYRKFSVKTGISYFLQGVIPLLPLLYISIVEYDIQWTYIIFVPCLVMYLFYLFLNRRIQGYTGDCCGALFLLVELSFYLTASCMLR